MNPEIYCLVVAGIKVQNHSLILPAHVEPMATGVFRGLSGLVEGHREFLTRDALARIQQTNDSILDVLLGGERGQKVFLAADPVTRVELGYIPPFGYEASHAYIAFLRLLWVRFLDTWLHIQEQNRMPLLKSEVAA